MSALLHAQRAVGVRGIHLEGCGFDPRLLRVGHIQHLMFPTMPLAVSGVHPQQHLCPVGGIHTPRSGMNVHQSTALVIVAGQQRAHFHLRDLLGDGIQFRMCLVGGPFIILCLCQLEEHQHII